MINYLTLLETYKRIAICGGPHTGKTTLSESIPHELTIHTDDYMGYKWEQVPPVIIHRLQNEPAFIVEGVQVARCLRKGLVVDCVIWLNKVYSHQDAKQQAMGKGVKTVFDEWRVSNRNKNPIFALSMAGNYFIDFQNSNAR